MALEYLIGPHARKARRRLLVLFLALVGIVLVASLVMRVWPP